jgi:predicted ribosomally synthesized peptide with SipW-like signal peptide
VQRHALRLTLVLGVMVTVLGGTGVFAVFTDQAQGGGNNVTSGSLARAADLHIAAATVVSGAVSCQMFADDTMTGQFTILDLQPTTPTQRAYVCLRNVGSAGLDLTAQAVSLFDVDIACTGDEAAAGDATCGMGAGELAQVVTVAIHQVDCGTLAPTGGFGQALDDWASTADAFAAPELQPATTACIEFELSYLSTATESQIQQAQSDNVRWNFRFEGTAS